jgi:hypothetical protein
MLGTGVIGAAKPESRGHVSGLLDRPGFSYSERITYPGVRQSLMNLIKTAFSI